MDIREAEVILYVSDQQSSTTFYSKLLCRLPVLNVPGMTEFELQPGLKFGLMPENGIAKIITPVLKHPSGGKDIPRCELYLLTEDADAAFAHALQSGALLVSEVSNRDWGHRVGYVADPDNHVIALAAVS